VTEKYPKVSSDPISQVITYSFFLILNQAKLVIFSLVIIIIMASSSSSYSFDDFEILEERSSSPPPPPLPGCITAYKARLKVSNTADEYYLLRVMIDEDRAQEEIAACLFSSDSSGSIRSSSLLDVKSYFKHEDQLFLVSDFIPESTSSLRAIAKERSSIRSDGLSVLTSDELCDLTFQLINVLAILHARPGKKLSHGDIRAENILCCMPTTIPAAAATTTTTTADPPPPMMMMIAAETTTTMTTTANYILANFNSKTFSPTRHSMSTMEEEYPENYYAPEILYLFETAGEAHKTAAGDIWSLGATLLSLSVGFVITDVKAKQLTWRFDNDVLSCFSPHQQSLWRSSVPVWVKDVIVQCLDCVAKNRPTAVSLQQEDQIGYIKYKKGYDIIQQQAFLIRELKESRKREESLLDRIDQLKDQLSAAKQQVMKGNIKIRSLQEQLEARNVEKELAVGGVASIVPPVYSNVKQLSSLTVNDVVALLMSLHVSSEAIAVVRNDDIDGELLAAIESPKELEDELKQSVVGAKARVLFGKLTRYRQEGVPLGRMIQSSSTKNNSSSNEEDSSGRSEKIEVAI